MTSALMDCEDLGELRHEILRLRDQAIGTVVSNEALTIRVAGQEEKITELEGQVVERDERITHLKHEIAERDERIAERDTRIAERDGRIAERDSRIAERDGRICELEAENAHLHAEIAGSIIVRLYRRITGRRAEKPEE